MKVEFEFDEELFTQDTLRNAQMYANSRCFSLVEKELRNKIDEMFQGQMQGKIESIINATISDLTEGCIDEFFEKKVKSTLIKLIGNLEEEI